MLYLNSLENVEASKTEKKYAICREKVASMTSIPELAPSEALLKRWQAGETDWDTFRQAFMDEMRIEFRKGEKSRLRGVAKYSLENDVTLHTPEPPGPQTYRAVLAEIVNGIWQREGREEQVIDLALTPEVDTHLTAEDLQMMAEIAESCDAFSPKRKSNRTRTCRACKHLDENVYMCPVKKRVVVHYEWVAPSIGV